MSDEKNDFMFACTSINTTLKLQKYFHLADYIDFQKGQRLLYYNMLKIEKISGQGWR